MRVSTGRVRAQFAAAAARHRDRTGRRLVEVAADNMPPGYRYHIHGDTIYVDGNLAPDDYAAALLAAVADLDGCQVIPFPAGPVHRRATAR